MRHNQIRERKGLETNWLSEVCRDVQSEPRLIPLSGEHMQYQTAATGDKARPDVAARGFWNSMDKTFVDVRVFHHGAKTNSTDTLENAYRKHEMEKKRKYNQRIIEVEKASFTPLIFSTSGGMGTECKKIHKRLASLISIKRGNSYSDTAAYIRRKLRFSILKTTLTAVRGYRGVSVKKDSWNSDINIIPFDAQHY